MIHVQGKIPRTVFVAFSGGVDSVAVVDFLRRNHQVSLAYVNHGDEIAKAEQEFVEHYAQQYNLPLFMKRANTDKPRDNSWEEHWRNERYRFFRTEITGTVITCHHCRTATA